MTQDAKVLTSRDTGERQPTLSAVQWEVSNISQTLEMNGSSQKQSLD